MMYEIPDIRTITDAKLIMSANRALLGEVRPNMRKVSIEYQKEMKKLILYVYYDQPLTQDELDEDVVGVIMTEIICNFPFDLEFEEKIVILPYPETIPQQGLTVYYRHEPLSDRDMNELRQQDGKIMKGIPDINHITNADLILSTNRALHGKVQPNMRRIIVEYQKEKRKLILHVYFDKPLSQRELDQDIISSILAEMSTFLPKELKLQKDLVILPYPKKPPENGIYIYARYEPVPKT
jgi:hypothetical protein